MKLTICSRTVKEGNIPQLLLPPQLMIHIQDRHGQPSQREKFQLLEAQLPCKAIKISNHFTFHCLSDKGLVGQMCNKNFGRKEFAICCKKKIKKNCMPMRYLVDFLSQPRSLYLGFRTCKSSLFSIAQTVTDSVPRAQNWAQFRGLNSREITSRSFSCVQSFSAFSQFLYKADKLTVTWFLCLNAYKYNL